MVGAPVPAFGFGLLAAPMLNFSFGGGGGGGGGGGMVGRARRAGTGRAGARRAGGRSTAAGSGRPDDAAAAELLLQ